MMYYGDHMSGWGWFGAAIGMIVFWGLLIALAVFVYRALADGGARSAGPAASDPRQILAERYARGEIDDDEFLRRLATLSRGEDPSRPVARR